MTHLNRRQFSTFAAAALTGGTVRAQGKRPEVARILVPFAAGGIMDQIARLLGEAMRGDVADVIVVESKSGAAGRIAIDALRHAPADGTTLLIHAGAIQSLYPYTFKQLTYSPFEDVVPVSLTTRIEYGFALGPAVPAEVKTLADYIAWIKKDLARASFATPGSGTPLHFLPLLLGKAINVDMNPIHYRGTAAAFPDLMGGTVPALSAPLPDLIQQLPTGKVRLLATSGPTRNKLTPQVATYAEQGYPELTSTDWYALYANGRTPPVLLDRLSNSVRTALASPAVMTGFSKMNIEPTGSTPAEAVQMAHADDAKASAVVKLLGYVPES